MDLRRSRMVARSVVPYMAEPSDDTTSRGGGLGASMTEPSASFFLRVSPGLATWTTWAPSSSTSRPVSFRCASISGIRGSASDSPFHRSKVTSRAPNSRFSAVRLTATKWAHRAR
ncbi:hypothetical protein D3C85_1016460 [compost metagenome]